MGWPCEDCGKWGVVPTCAKCGIGTAARKRHLEKYRGSAKKPSRGIKAKPANIPKPITETPKVICE